MRTRFYTTKDRLIKQFVLSCSSHNISLSKMKAFVFRNYKVKSLNELSNYQLENIIEDIK